MINEQFKKNADSFSLNLPLFLKRRIKYNLYIKRTAHK